jgi:hypothetical protein
MCGLVPVRTRLGFTTLCRLCLKPQPEAAAPVPVVRDCGGKSAGSIVAITYDGDVSDGDALVTSTGRTYLVLDSRRVNGLHPNRHKLRCLVWDQPVPDGATTHRLRWYTRDRKAS